MRCAWKELLGILPPWLREQTDRLGRDSLQELRLRIGQPPELILGEGSRVLLQRLTGEDLNFCINTASRYSPWAAETVRQGYLTAAGGHRIGLCGEAVVRNGELTGLRNPASACIRVARDLDTAGNLPEQEFENLLILGPPGTGKTTLLRDLIRKLSDRGPGSLAVVDERRELFPMTGEDWCFSTGARTDILSGSPKPAGIDMVLRTMGPERIAVDEITAQEDCRAILRAGWCGVRLLATAHAASVSDFRTRTVYRTLAESGLFDAAVVMHPDKSWHMERMGSQ